MGMVISGVLLTATMLLTAMTISGTILQTGATQAVSLNQALEVRGEQLGTSVTIISTAAQTTGGGTEVTVVVKNAGAVSVSAFPDMDVLAQYTTQTGDSVLKRLTHVTGAPGSDEWSLCAGVPMACSISPDTFNPNIWDPDEEATLILKLVPPMKNNTTGSVVVVMPSGVSSGPATF